MIRISELKLKLDYTERDLKELAAKKLRLCPDEIKKTEMVRRSLDARDKKHIKYVIAADVSVKSEGKVLASLKGAPGIHKAEKVFYKPPAATGRYIGARPYVIGAGPAGLFCAYFLAFSGLKPILIEQGESASSRTNVQFGEGGAGTFSDGKLASSVKDVLGRKTEVLRVLVRHGAPREILYEAKPHLGTDLLPRIVKNIREEIIRLGGDVFFNTKFEGFTSKDGRLQSIKLAKKGGEREEVPCSCLVLAIGHSSRETIRALYESGLSMRAKPFAVGIRAEHLQDDINRAQYGEDYKERYEGLLKAADYKLAAKTEKGRAVYTFCMCPGGYVINASSEPARLCVNGMSFSRRDGVNANSAVVVNINPEDIGAADNPMAALCFQEKLEERAYLEGAGSIPVQRLEDFRTGGVSRNFGKITPQTMGKFSMGDLNNILPDFVAESIKEAFALFGKKIKGFDDPDTVLSAVESRTSSPVRILRNEDFESSVPGIYPCGEGAGYAGGIMSSAVDGIKVFEKICTRFAP